MIVPMKKAVILTLDREKDITLRELRDIGLLHLEKSEQEPVSVDITRLEQEKSKLEEALSILPVTEGSQVMKSDMEEAKLLLQDILEDEKKLREVEDRLQQINKDRESLALWDNIDPQDLKMLKEKGVHIGLYSIPLKGFDRGQWSDKLVDLGKSKGLEHVMYCSQDESELPPWEITELPELGLNELELEEKSLLSLLDSIEQDFISYAEKESLLLWYQSIVLQDLEYEIARLKFSEQDKLALITGYVPLDELESLKTRAKEKQWGLVTTDPEEEDEVPTKLKTGKVGGLLSPVLDLLGITPGYREFDVSFFFLSFFTVFAAMLIGDAGYGSLFLLAVVAVLIKTLTSGKKAGSGIALLMLLSITTIIWGALNGNWFGSATLMKVDFLSRFRLNVFSGTEDEINDKVMRVSFFLGVAQLGLACIQRFLRELPQLKAFSQLGWFGVVVGMYYLVLNQVLGDTSVPYKTIFIIMGTGIALIFLFGYQEKGQNFFIGVLKSFPNLFTLFLDVVGSFANMMSYIRLFAVGLASLKIAQTFNTMAAPMLNGSAAAIGAVGILIAGHSLNIILALLAVFVHAIRLNVLEYSGQLGMEWSGFKYEPFRVRNVDSA